MMTPSHSLVDLVTMIGNIAITISVVVAVIFGIVQVKSAERDRRERLTLETLRYFQSREFAELIRFITLAEMPQNADALRALPAEEYLMFVQMAQLMESLGQMVAEGFIDIALVEKTLGSFVSNSWEKYQPVLLDMRTREVDPDPYMGEYFQWLAELIDQRVRDTPRKPFHLTGARPQKR